MDKSDFKAQQSLFILRRAYARRQPTCRMRLVPHAFFCHSENRLREIYPRGLNIAMMPALLGFSPAWPLAEFSIGKICASAGVVTASLAALD